MPPCSSLRHRGLYRDIKRRTRCVVFDSSASSRLCRTQVFGPDSHDERGMAQRAASREFTGSNLDARKKDTQTTPGQWCQYRVAPKARIQTSSSVQRQERQRGEVRHISRCRVVSTIGQDESNLCLSHHRPRSSSGVDTC